MSYKEYLDSFAWKAIKKTKLEETPKCEVCGIDATTVHHLSYERLGKELENDIVSICDICHHKCHYVGGYQIKNSESELRKRFEEIKHTCTPLNLEDIIQAAIHKDKEITLKRDEYLLFKNNLTRLFNDNQDGFKSIVTKKGHEECKTIIYYKYMDHVIVEYIHTFTNNGPYETEHIIEYDDWGEETSTTCMGIDNSKNPLNIIEVMYYDIPEDIKTIPITEYGEGDQNWDSTHTLYLLDGVNIDDLKEPQDGKINYKGYFYSSGKRVHPLFSLNKGNSYKKIEF